MVNYYNSNSRDDDGSQHDDKRLVDNHTVDTHVIPHSSIGRAVVNTSLPGNGGISSMQTLLINIQGLLKVAADNARLQEKQNSFEIGNIFEETTLLHLLTLD